MHLGSLYAAAASYLDARSHGGRWLLRIEDLDRAREAPGSADGILRTLQRFGFEWDGAVMRQSERTEAYAAALEQLANQGLTFQCSCSRLQLEDDTRYPGHCRVRPLLAGVSTATRLRVEPGSLFLTDRIQGTYRQDVAAAVGDVILRRRDQIFAYLLAVVVDDAAQGVTHVLRGADLLDNTPRQMYLQRVLELREPVYAHVPVLTEPDNAKLAKSSRSVALDTEPALNQLRRVFSLLGLGASNELAGASIAEAWGWAFRVWDANKVPKRLNVCVSP